jgi:hypothetical protein
VEAAAAVASFSLCFFHPKKNNDQIFSSKYETQGQIQLWI